VLCLEAKAQQLPKKWLEDPNLLVFIEKIHAKSTMALNILNEMI
jgi:hypothetical protein